MLTVDRWAKLEAINPRQSGRKQVEKIWKRFDSFDHHSPNDCITSPASAPRLSIGYRSKDPH